MQRRSFIRNSSLTIASLALLDKKSLAAFLANPAWNIKMLTKNIGIFTEKGGTIAFYLSGEGAVVVDAQFPDSAQHLIDELKKKSEKPFRLLINTHHHGDHTSGNIAFKGLVPHVLAHANSKANQQRVAKEQNKEDKQLFPDQVFTNLWSENVGKEKISLHYYGAGHTNGDSLVHFEKANILHMGDLVFNRRHPYIDKTAGANISNWIKLLEKTTATFSKKTQYVCGHSGNGYDVLLNKDDLNAFRKYLENVLKFTETEIKAGKSKDEILKVTEIPGSPEWKGEGIARPLTAAYEELTAK
ncbi:MAG: MBL fold metallo-hydrolase [Chitinophagaceae bacterium]|nr:MBL fold metallo-hydrolase [Chitinophagaceae bacterium]MCC7379166.1 MBL fold metallo-hydrolase [Chitinophagaceae bacterium]